MPLHQQKQIEVINQIENQIKNNSLNSSSVSPVDNYNNDLRICFTSIHIPKESLISKVNEIIGKLKKIEPEYYYYSNDSLHMTIKNLKVINDPPRFNADKEKVE